MKSQKTLSKFLLAGVLAFIASVSMGSFLFAFAVGKAHLNPILAATLCIAFVALLISGLLPERRTDVVCNDASPSFDWATFWAVLAAVGVIWLLHCSLSPVFMRLGRALHGFEHDGHHESEGKKKKEDEE